MVKKERFRLVDCSALPYSRARAEATYAPTVVTSPSQAPTVDGRPFIRLRALTGMPTLDWPPRLPETDPRGVATGKNFECWKKARDGKTGISGNWYSLKGSRMQPCHSFLEAKLRAYFDISPFVVECRTQYPSWNKEEYEQYYLAGKPFPANKVMTIDFMLTLSIPGIPYLIYHGVSGKPRDLQSLPKTVSRHERESAALWQWGSTHEVMDEFTIPKQEYANYLVLKSWFLWTDIESRINDARVLAKAIRATKAQGKLDRVLPMVGKRLGHGRGEAYRLFAVAVFLGHIWLDHRFPLGISKPLVLFA